MIKFDATIECNINMVSLQKWHTLAQVEVWQVLIKRVLNNINFNQDVYI